MSSQNKRKAPEKEDGDLLTTELSAHRRLSVRKWKGVLLIDIRETYDKDGKTLPGKKGISLTLEQFKVLADSVPAVLAAAEEAAASEQKASKTAKTEAGSAAAASSAAAADGEGEGGGGEDDTSPQ